MNTARHSRAGFSLVEIALALGIMGFCLVALFGLLPIGLGSNQASVEQTVAADIVSRVAADLASTPRSASTSLMYSIPLSGSPVFYLSETDEVFAEPDKAKYRVQVDFYPPTMGRTTAARLLVSWPAPAAPANATGFFETVAGLNRK